MQNSHRVAGPCLGAKFGFTKILSSPKSKIFLFTGIPICGSDLLSPCRHEGRFAVVTKRGAGCDGPLPASGVFACQTKRRRRTVKSCGPGAATLALRRLGAIPPATGAKEAVPRGEHEISRQTIARGRPGCPGCTCQTRVRFLLPIAHGAAGAAGARPSLRPLTRERATRGNTRAENTLRERFPMFPRRSALARAAATAIPGHRQRLCRAPLTP
jgi:hypothetical protein